MNLTALTLAKVDGDIIEEFVRHTARLVDRHFIVGNVALDSADETSQALQPEGFALTDIMADLARRVFEESPSDYLKTGSKRRAAKKRACGDQVRLH